MRIITALWCAILLLPLYVAAPAQARQALPQQDANILMKEEFEGAFANDPNCAGGKCEVPENWRVWFIPHRETDPQGVNYPPEYAQTTDPNRVKSGAAAQRLFTENRTFTAGIYRVVTGVKPGSKLRFTAWGEVWSTNDNSPISARPSTDIRVKVGIDPMAEGDAQPSPFNGRVIWSPEQDAKDAYVQFTVEVEAKSSTVIVWTFTTMKDAVRHNEAYWDDAVLEVVAPPAVDPAASEALTITVPVTASQIGGPEPVVQASPGVTYTIKEGDTLFGIAIQFNTTVEDIRKQNTLDGDLLSIGQVLVIQPPTEGTAPAQPPPQSQSPTQPGEATTPAANAPASNGGALCVQAYFDNNGDGKRDADEAFVPNVLFSIMASGAVAGTHTSDGVNEPHCFTNLVPGAYTASATILPAFVATTPLDDTINVSAGSNSQFSVGLRRASDENVVIESTATPTPAASAENGGTSVLAVLAMIVGALMVVGSIGLGILLFLQSRRL